MSFQSRKGPKKKTKNKMFYNLESLFFKNFLLVSFSLLLFFCTSKVIKGYLVIMIT